ncbi:uncharacterized protein cubi_02091 [Cryptosporidium ubiquitum]|uniref:Uncharacterized protein n=1 Tax=Cryptosporidium ubiquitum TaxID=857276 RepID=A0A1J4MMT9_9CRYT|nr:uncharacterized protein cubi_02091 [Cryptosporidium ubiquitum]OII75570.1 hypothetical protein cubi_02091 [Cryptosporidium ubiquitum]
MHTLVTCAKIDDLIEPLKKQIFEQVEFPNTNWEALSIEEEREYKEIYDNVMLEKPEEYNVIIREFEESLGNYKVDQVELETISKSLANKMDILAALSKEDKIQQVLGGKGIIELSELNRNLEFGKNLLGKELSISKSIIENFHHEIMINLKQPVDNLVLKINQLSSNAEKYLKAYQLLNVYRERSHQIYNSDQVISKNTVSVSLLVNSWAYILSEIEALIKDQLKPLIDESKVMVASGNDILKKLELINSIIANTVLVKYGDLMNEKVEQKNGFETLIKEIKIKALNMEEIGITDDLIKWRLEIIPSILNIFRSPLSKLFTEINKDLENVNFVDGIEQINERIQESDEFFSELDQIKLKMNSIWLTLKYLSKDEVLGKRNEKIKAITNCEDAYNENKEKITFLYGHAVTERNQLDSIARNLTLSESHQIFLGLNTLKCLAEYYQVYKGNDTNVLFTYSKINQTCLGFFLNKIHSFNSDEKNNYINLGEIKDPVLKFEYIISHFISVIFPNSRSNHEDSNFNSSLNELIQEIESSYNQIESNEAKTLEFRRKNDRLRKIIEKIGEYNEFIIGFTKSLDNIKKTTSIESFEILKRYLTDLNNIFEDHIKESIGNKDDAAILFDQLFKELVIMSEEFSEKELNNDHLKVSVIKRFEDVQLLFNDFIAKVNLDYQRSSRLNSKEFIDNTQTNLEEIDIEIRIFNEELTQVNEFMYKQHSNNILSLATFVYASKLLLNPVTNLKDENKLIGEYFPDPFTHPFREKYSYILLQLGYYYNVYQDFKEKKKNILEKENQINSQLLNIESELMKRSNITTIDSSTMYKIQKQRKIAERILSGYIMLTITLYHSRSEDIKKTVLALDNSISNFNNQISVFQKQNKLDGKFGFRNIIKNILRSRKYLKLRRYYKRMKKFQDYLVHKREQMLEFFKFSENTITSLNRELIKIIDHYLCRKKGESDLEYYENEKSINHENMEPIQIIMGDLYNIFSRIGRLEYYHSPKYLMSNSKFLGELLKQYRQINYEINKYQKKAQKIFLTQQKTLDNAFKLIRIAIPASYMISKYNKFPKEYQRYTFKTGKLDIIGDEPRHINIRGWNLKKGKKTLSLENELMIERKYIKNDQEYYEIKKDVEEKLKKYSLLPPEKTLDKPDTKTLIFFIPDELVDQMIFEIERNNIILRQGYNFKGNNDEKNSIQTVMSNYVHELVKRRKSLYTQLSSKPFITKQAQCSIKDEKDDFSLSFEDKKE